MIPDNAHADTFLGFFAIYDHRLLWRANLFIDERVDNAADWNDVHPISFDEWCYTENANGGQINIRSFTNFWDNRSVHGKVAYAHGCFDSPKNFNMD